MKGAKFNEALELNAIHALYRKDGKWFHHLKDFPGVLFDEEGYIIVESKKEYLEKDEFQHGVHLHVKNGISSLTNYQKFSAQQLKKLTLDAHQNFHEETIREIREISRIRRNRQVVSKLKKLYEDSCQICGLRLRIGNNCFYSEVHHIVPLGIPHGGIDRVENMICVCPNHHVLLDFGAIKINETTFKMRKHKIEMRFMEYHNEHIFQK